MSFNAPDTSASRQPIKLQQVLDLREDGIKLLSELFGLGVAGFGCNVATQVFQVIESAQNRIARGRGSDRIGKLLVDVNAISQSELPLRQG